jgi:signal transduction histidine kinase
MSKISIRSIVLREVAIVMMMVTAVLTGVTSFLQLRSQRQAQIAISRDFESTLKRDEDSLLLQVVLAKSQDLNFYFSGLATRFPQIQFCMDLNPAIDGLAFSCRPSESLSQHFFILGNRNNSIRFELATKSWPQTLVDIGTSPIFYSGIIAALIIALFLKFRLRSLLTNPLIDVRDSIKRFASGVRSPHTIVDNRIVEWSEIQVALSELLQNMIELEKAQHQAGQARVAKQIIHDIGSPLSLLRIASKAFVEVPVEKRELISAAVERIDGIIAQLNSEMTGGHEVSTDILPLVAAVIEEKRLIASQSGKIQIYYDGHEGNQTVQCMISAQLFKRVLSNVIGNAMEAIPTTGTVSVSIKSNLDRVRIEITDTGKGIPSHLIETVQFGQSYGKQGGQGLGLSHARATVESWSGSLTIDSRDKLGTVVTISLPLSTTKIETLQVQALGHSCP